VGGGCGAIGDGAMAVVLVEWMQIVQELPGVKTTVRNYGHFVKKPVIDCYHHSVIVLCDIELSGQSNGEGRGTV